MKIYDCHCHLTLPEIEKDLSNLLKIINDKNILLSICSVKPSDASALKEIKKKNKQHLINIGLHPWWIDENTNIHEQVKSIIENLEYFDGLGEIGLDFLKSKNTKNKQIEFLETILENVSIKDKVAVFHCVKAHSELLKISKNHKKKIIHGYYQSKQLAKNYLDEGFYFSLGPQFLSSNKDDLISYIPIDRMLIETDSPAKLNDSSSEYGFPYRSPLFIEEVYSYFSKVLKLDIHELQQSVSENMSRLYIKKG